MASIVRASPKELKSRWFSSVPDLFAGKFFNRTTELEGLQDLLSPANIGDPGSIILLTGPKDSGKSALLREFYSRQRTGTYNGVPAFVDMRVRSNMNPSQFATNLADSFAKSLQLKVEADERMMPGGQWGFNVSSEMISLTTPWGALEFHKKQNDPIDMVMAAFEGYMSVLPKHKSGFYAGFPTIFIDEANALASWTTTPEGAANLESVLRFLVRISKQQNAANVVLASSENFFKEWLCVRTPFSGHNVTVATVGHLNQEEAREFVREAIKDSELKREGLEEEVWAVWDDVYAHYGGAMLLLRTFVRLAVRAKPGEVRKKWELEKRQFMSTARVFVASGFRPDTLSQALCAERMVSPKWTTEDWKVVVQAMAGAQDGVVPYYSLRISGAALASMIHYDFLHYRVRSGWDRDIIVPDKEWPIVMPVSRAQHLVMKEIAQEGSW